LPEPLKDQGRTDPGGASGDALAAGVGSENGELIRKPSERLEEGIELAAGQKLIEAAEPMQNSLFDLAVDPLVVDDKQIRAGTVGLSANEQMAAPVSL